MIETVKARLVTTELVMTTSVMTIADINLPHWLMSLRRLVALIAACLLMLSTSKVMADQIRVAVASNFTSAITELAERFEFKSNHKIVLIFGSTGKHYAQIKHGAPFDAFLAADIIRPKRLEQEGNALLGSRFTYAIGRVILWSPSDNIINSNVDILKNDSLNYASFRHLAIANPKLAPYGKAAEEILMSLGIWKDIQSRIVRGESIGQTFQFIKTGNAELGFVAYSQLNAKIGPIEGSYWKVPQSFYTPIEQQAVLLNDNQTAREFLQFIRSEESKKIIQSFGYSVP